MRAPIHRWVTEPVSPDVESALRRLTGAAGATHIAVMPDVHLAHDVCIGTVFATRDRIYPAAVGGDIGCGVTAIAFDASSDLLADERRAARLFAGLYRAVPSNRHRSRQVLPDALDPEDLSAPPLRAHARRGGRVQFGTLGRGNHFLEFQADATERLWLMIHSGSRAVGSSVRDFHLERAEPHPTTPLLSLEAESESGGRYLADHAWALAYAHANRERMVDRVVALVREEFGARVDETSRIDCAHNHVQTERHFGEEWLVHRKGAVSAGQDEPGIIPGSMGTHSVHTLGRGHANALRSSSHGAGRVMSRSEARRRVRLRSFRHQMRGVWYDHRRERALVDEAPRAYRDLGAVMRAQRELTRVVRTVRPLLSFKGT